MSCRPAPNAILLNPSVSCETSAVVSPVDASHNATLAVPTCARKRPAVRAKRDAHYCACACHSEFVQFCPLFRYSKRAPQIQVSPPPLASRLPIRTEHETQHLSRMAVAQSFADVSPFSRSHSQICPVLPVASMSPYRTECQAINGTRYDPSNVWRCSPVFASQRCAERFSLPVAIVLPSGLYAAL